MNGLEHLASLLAPTVRIGDAPMPSTHDIDRLIATLQARISASGISEVPADLQHASIQRFWTTPRLDTLKDARLVAFGLCLPAGPEGACLLEDRPRLGAVLDGVDQWLHEAHWFRRCYQGLVWSYFSYDIDAEGVSADARHNWERLRDYLGQRAGATVAKLANPDWVKTVVCHPHLFKPSPCEPHVDKVLRGDFTQVDAICAQLGIGASSWFMRQLVQARVSAAVRLDDADFCSLLPSLIDMLAGAAALRDAGLARLLERYAGMLLTPVHDELRDALARAWGSPWHAANALHWDGIRQPARALASEWIKADLIARFFARSGHDTRRAAFWQRYSRSMQKIEFAFAPAALGEPPCAEASGDARMRGLVSALVDGSSDDRAMVMTMGRAVIVEFGDPALPVQFHDLSQPLPFDMSAPLRMEADADNSLRHTDGCLSLAHRDGLQGWRQWEQMFEAALKDRFDIRAGVAASTQASSFVDLSDLPGLEPSQAQASTARTRRWQQASAGEDVHWLTAEAASVPFSRADLEVLARVHSLHLEDDSLKTGRLWVRTKQTDQRIAQVLKRWGFTQVAGEGWYRSIAAPADNRHGG